MARIGFIGTGHIAAPLIRFLVGKGYSVTVSNRNADTAAALAQTHGVSVGDNQHVLDRSDIVFLCLRPQVAADVIAPLHFRADQRIISVMAGISLHRLGQLCAPAHDMMMTIPLGYLEQGGCPLAACPSAIQLKELFEPENFVFEVVDEKAFNQHFAICAFVPGVLDLMTTAATWLGAQTGDNDQAARFTRQLLTGFLAALPDEGAHLLPQERDALATQGTLSLQMTTALQDGGAHGVLRDALLAIGSRLDA